MKVSFGIGIRKTLTGAELSVRIMQICAMLPVLYLFLGSGVTMVLVRRGILSWLFDIGFSCLPRLEVMGISVFYRISRSEVLVNFLLLGVALILGLVGGAILKGRTARTTRLVMITWIVADLVLRLLPFAFNKAFGFPASVIGFAVHSLCLVLTLLDLRAAGKKTDAQTVVC